MLCEGQRQRQQCAGKHIPHLESLGICANEIEYVKVPDTLSTLKFWCPTGVNLHVVRPQVLADNLKYLELRYDENSSPDVTDILDAMKSFGKHYTMICEDEYMSEGVVYGDQAVVNKCPCQACETCLSSEGILDPLLIPYTGLPVYVRSP